MLKIAKFHLFYVSFWLLLCMNLFFRFTNDIRVRTAGIPSRKIIPYTTLSWTIFLILKYPSLPFLKSVLSLLRSVMLVIPLYLCLLILLNISEVTLQGCYSARRFCTSDKIDRRCRVGVDIVCKCSDLRYSSDCDNFSPRNRFEEQLKRLGQGCTPKRCRLKLYWCQWSQWKTEFTNSSCAGTYHHRKRSRQRCCPLFVRKANFQCFEKFTRTQHQRRSYFEKSGNNCEVPGTVRMAWYEKLGYGIAASVGFAFVVKCLRAWFCRKRRQAPPTEVVLTPPTEENFENAPLEHPEGDSGPPETVPLEPTAPPPSYDEVTNRPDQFKPPTPEKRY